MRKADKYNPIHLFFRYSKQPLPHRQRQAGCQQILKEILAKYEKRNYRDGRINQQQVRI